MFYLYHDFISVTCPMCRRPIFQAHKEKEEKEPASSYNLFQWIRSRVPFSACGMLRPFRSLLDSLRLDSEESDLPRPTF